MENKIVAYGEMMIRLVSPLGVTLAESPRYDAYYGGTEGNTLILLSAFGEKTSYVTAFPDNPLGQGAVRFLKNKGVDTSHVILKPNSRIGLYYYENNFGQRNPKVVYDRAHSAIRELKDVEVNATEILSDATWFHVTGISFSIGENARNVAYSLLNEAKRRNLPVSFDFNYRSTLISKEDAHQLYLDIVPKVDYLFGSIRDIVDLLELKEVKSEETIIQEFFAKYPVKVFAITKKASNDNSFLEMSAEMYVREDGSVKKYVTEKISFAVLDGVGGGDCFTAGVIEGFLENPKDHLEALRFGLACDVLKHSVPSDTLSLDKETVKRYLLETKRGILR